MERREKAKKKVKEQIVLEVEESREPRRRCFHGKGSATRAAQLLLLQCNFIVGTKKNEFDSPTSTPPPTTGRSEQTGKGRGGGRDLEECGRVDAWLACVGVEE
jgi:hypothetical protein